MKVISPCIEELHSRGMLSSCGVWVPKDQWWIHAIRCPECLRIRQTNYFHRMTTDEQKEFKRFWGE